jgi:hypothetical protein
VTPTYRSRSHATGNFSHASGQATRSAARSDRQRLGASVPQCRASLWSRTLFRQGVELERRNLQHTSYSPLRAGRLHPSHHVSAPHEWRRVRIPADGSTNVTSKKALSVASHHAKCNRAFGSESLRNSLTVFRRLARFYVSRGCFLTPKSSSMESKTGSYLAE